MKALCYGLPFGASLAVLDGFRSARGHEVRTVALQGQADYKLKKRETAADLICRVAQEWTPDCLLCWCPEVVPPPLEIEECPVKTAAIVSDWNIYFPQLEYNLSRYDVVITDRLGSKTLQLAGVIAHYVCPIYAHQPRVHRLMGLERDIDVVFAGNLNHAIHVRRGRLLEKIAALSPRRRVVIASGLPPEEYATLLNRGRIVFNHALRGEMNLRCFEALACGSLLFLGADNLEARDWLRDREDAVFYEDDSLVPLIEEYLDHPEEASRIAANGQLRLQAELSVEKRLDMLIDFIAAQPMGTRSFRQLPESEKAFHEILQYASAQTGSQRKHAHSVIRKAARRFSKHPGIMMSRAQLALYDFQQRDYTDSQSANAAGLKVVIIFAKAAGFDNESVPFWLNMALIHYLAGLRDTAISILDIAMRSQSMEWVSVLMGRMNDPYYARIREDLAFGRLGIELLWAMGATFRARIACDEEDYKHVRAYARRAIKLAPDIPTPYFLLATAHMRLGKPGAALEVLEKSAALSSFDAEHRALHIDALRALDRRDEARALAEDSLCIFQALQGSDQVVAQFKGILAMLQCSGGAGVFSDQRSEDKD